MSRITIPDEAYTAAQHHRETEADASIEGGILAAAPLIVATELRYWADNFVHQYPYIAAQLYERADELHPQKLSQ